MAPRVSHVVTVSSESVSLAEAMRNGNLTVALLAQQAGVSKSTIYKALRQNSKSGINQDSGEKIARALDTRVNKINWSHALSDWGRKPGTGIRRKKTQPLRGFTDQCPTCPYMLPATNVCSNCA